MAVSVYEAIVEAEATLYDMSACVYGFDHAALDGECIAQYDYAEAALTSWTTPSTSHDGQVAALR